MKIDRSSQHEGSANQKYGIWLTSSLFVGAINQGAGLGSAYPGWRPRNAEQRGGRVGGRYQRAAEFFCEVCGVPQTAVYRRSLCSKRVRGSTRVGK